MTGEGLWVLDPPSPPSQSHLETHDGHVTLRYKGPSGCQGSSYSPCKEADNKATHSVTPSVCLLREARPRGQSSSSRAGAGAAEHRFPSGALTESWAWTE